jgi:TetR/AcrR family transcriptional regulator, mexCD-oprJ operon repressor
VGASTDQALGRASAALAKNPAATMAQIASEVGVSRATLHRWFPARQDLISALAAAATEQLHTITATVEESGLTGIAALEALVDQAVGLVPTYGFLSKEPVDETDPSLAMFEKVLDRWVTLVESAQRLGEVRIDIPARWIVLSIQGLATAAFDGTCMGFVGHREVPRLVSQILFTGIRAHSPQSPQPELALQHLHPRSSS